MRTVRFNVREFSQLWTLLLALTSFILGLGIVYFSGINQNNFGDAPDYLSAALTISNQEPYLREDLAWPFFRAPGYPFVISTIWTLTGIQEVWILKFFNVLCHAMSTLLVFKLALLALSQKKSFVIAFVYAINPFSLLQLTGVQTEPLITALFLAFTYLLCQNVSKLNIVLLSVSSIFVIATRPEYLFMILPTIVLSFFLKLFPKDSRQRAVVVFASIFLSLSWWGIQNQKATGAFIPLTDATNFQLWQGSTNVIQQNYPWRTTNSLDFNAEQMKKLVTEVENKKLEWGTNYTSASISQRSHFWREAYLENVIEDPMRYLKYTFVKAAVFWRPFLNPPSYGANTSLASALILLPLTAFMILGLFRYRNRIEWQVLILTFFVGFVFLTLIHAVQVADLRYRIPLFVPFATLMAGRVLTDSYPVLKSKLSRSKPSG